jgi:SAM-dependent methyltransferase
MPCPICSHAGTTPHLTVGSYQYVACTDCGAVRLHPFPDPAATVELYDDTYFLGAANGGYHDYAADAAIHRRNARARLRKLGPPPVPNATLVDVGCAHGYTLLEARERGWAPQGVEVNATARAASSHAGFPTAPALSELGLAPGSVHAITFFQVLEHLPDPAAALREAAALLAPGGRILVETWNRDSLIARAMKARWQQATPPSVLWLFDEADLQRMCAAAGLELVRWQRSAKWVSVGLVTGQLSQRGSKLARRIGTRLQRAALPYALGDLVTAHARKRTE